MTGLVIPVSAASAIDRKLAGAVDCYKILSRVHLAASQLPARIPGVPIHRPPEW